MGVLDELVAERRAKMDAEERARVAELTGPTINRAEQEIRERIAEHGAETLRRVAEMEAEAEAAVAAMKASAP